MKTTLTASIPIVAGGVNIFCDGFTAKTDLKDGELSRLCGRRARCIANADIIVGTASGADELTRLRIIENVASTDLSAVNSTQIDTPSIESVSSPPPSPFRVGGADDAGPARQRELLCHRRVPDRGLLAGVGRPDYASPDGGWRSRDRRGRGGVELEGGGADGAAQRASRRQLGLQRPRHRR
eukprot:353652-Rhodomonas_salina.1